MAYVFKQAQIDAIFDDTGIDDGTITNRAFWQGVIQIDMNAGIFVVKTDSQPAIDFDAAGGGILIGNGGASATDIALYRGSATELRVRNAVNSLYRNIAAADPIDPQHLVTRAYGDANYGTTATAGASPIGAMDDWTALADPGVQADGSEWVICDGRTLTRASYPVLNSLYATDGYLYGNGNGTTTFEIPDLAGHIPIGAGGIPGLTLNQTAGDWDHVHGVPNVPQHNHAITDPGHGHGTSEGAGHGHRALIKGFAASFDGPTQIHNALITEAGGVYTLQNLGSVDLVEKSATGLTVDSGTTGISINNTGSPSPDTAAANPPVRAFPKIVRIA